MEVLVELNDIRSGVGVGPCRHANTAGGSGSWEKVDGEEDINCHTRKWTDINQGVFLDTLPGMMITYPLLNPRYF